MHLAIAGGVRALQFVISLTILAIAADFIRHQVLGDAPVTTRYSTFTGGFGMLVCGVGAVALFVTSIPALVPIALDGLMGLFFLAGGIAWAVGLRGTGNCNDPVGMLGNQLLNRGSVSTDNDVYYGIIEPDDDELAVFNKLRGACQRGTAEEVLQFIAFGAAISLIGIGYSTWKRGTSMGSRHPAV
ncbi:hypothetical protein MMYC01_205686 [Madurella mycetomatis]|uniref:MARVEL domain-containing protein n=1 Tax=Madurella mycetomatis TaxID=100816 RepID=A0A175W5U1_9PEZI|nr:hypothetical protein MMYC01_205686 [Madurella mycetomatis]